MTRLGVLAVLLAGIACSDPGDESRAGPRSNRYARPSVASLLSSAIGHESQGVDPELVREAARRIRAHPASQALWNAVIQAERAGLSELYGVEIFGLAEPSYQAVVFVRTGGNRIHCLYADAEVQASRTDIGSVRALPVPPEVFALLRRRIETELPLERTTDLTAEVDDGSMYLFHAFRDGESRHALWYEPLTELGLEKDALARFRRAAPVENFSRALWAAVPAGFFPGEDEAYMDTYAQAPPYRPSDGG